MYQAKIGIPPDRQRIIYAGCELDDTVTLAARHIYAESTFHVIVRDAAKRKQPETHSPDETAAGESAASESASSAAGASESEEAAAESREPEAEDSV